MRVKYVPYISSIVFFTVAILGINLFLVFVYGAVSGIQSGTDLFRAPFFFKTLANVLFLEGGIMLTFGALVEFFLKAHSYSLARRMLLPYSLASRAVYQTGRAAHEVKDSEAASIEEKRSGGWILIFLGTLLAIASLASALISMK